MRQCTGRSAADGAASISGKAGRTQVCSSREHRDELTSISSRESCWAMQRNTFFLLLSAGSPASRISSRI